MDKNKQPEICIRIKTAKNGFTVSGVREDKPDSEETYVFQKLEDALKEVPGMLSVLKADTSEPQTRGALADEEGDY